MVANVEPAAGDGVTLLPTASPKPPAVMSRGQVVVAVTALAMLAATFAWTPLATAVVVNAALLVFFGTANVTKLWLMERALQDDAAIAIDRRVLRRLRDDDLPMYTILLPVFREASMIDQLVAGITALDYPQD